MNRKLMVACVVFFVLSFSFVLMADTSDIERKRMQLAEKVQTKIAKLEKQNREVPEILKRMFGKLNRKNELNNENNRKQRLYKPSTWYWRQTLQEDWDNGGWVWDYLVKPVYNNTTHLETERFEYKWDNGVWNDDYWTTFAYDGNGFLSESIEKYYDSSCGSSRQRDDKLETFKESQAGWVESWKTTFVNDANGNTLVLTDYTWDAGAWHEDLRITSTYDGNSNLLTELWEFWDDDLNDWDPWWHDIYTWSGGVLMQILYQTNFSGVWYDTGKEIYSYDGNGNNTEILGQYSPDDGANWLNEDLNTMTYDGNGNMITNTKQEWDVTANPPDWANRWRTTNEYDGSGNNTRYLWENWNETLGKSASVGWEYYYQYLMYWHPYGEMSNEVYQWWNGSAWGNGYHYNYYYSQSTTVEKDQNTVPGKYKLSNYPNPFNPETVIRFDLPKDGDVSVFVYDLMGRLIKTLAKQKNYTAGSNHEIVWDGTDDQNRRVASGIYFYRFESETYNRTKRCILVK